MPLMVAGVFVLILGAFLIVSCLGIYNALVTDRNRYKNAFSQIDVQLQRRHDLIPNLVETTKAYLKHESQTLEAVVQARNSAVQARKQASQDPTDERSMTQLMGAEGALTGALGKLFAVVESYPDLKANQNVAQLSEELSTTENRIAFARQAYNDSVMSYNIAREKFPNSVIAGMFNFQTAQLFETQSQEERAVPKVSFG